MSARSAGWLAAILVTLVALALIVSGITDAGLWDWWNANSLTTDTVSGLLVLLITILVVNQLLNLREARQRSHAVHKPPLLWPRPLSQLRLSRR